MPRLTNLLLPLIGIDFDEPLGHQSLGLFFPLFRRLLTFCYTVSTKQRKPDNIIESIRCQRSDDIPVTWPPTFQFASGFAASGSFLLGLSAGRTTGGLRLGIVFGSLFLRGAGAARSLEDERIHDE